MTRLLMAVSCVFMLNFSSGCQYFSGLMEDKSAPKAVKTEAVQVGIKQAPVVNIAGIYHVNGSNPGGDGQYHGTVTISPAGGDFKVHWEVGTVYDGVGTLKGRVFEVKWGRSEEPVGLVTYTILEDGSLRGTWHTYKNPSSLGTETLIPQR